MAAVPAAVSSAPPRRAPRDSGETPAHGKSQLFRCALRRIGLGTPDRRGTPFKVGDLSVTKRGRQATPRVGCGPFVADGASSSGLAERTGSGELLGLWIIGHLWTQPQIHGISAWTATDVGVLEGGCESRNLDSDTWNFRSARAKICCTSCAGALNVCYRPPALASLSDVETRYVE